MERQFKGLRAIEPYQAGEQPHEKQIIKLNTNENAYTPSPLVEQALQGFSAHELRKYSTLDQDHLRQALAKNLGVEAEQIIVGNGSDDILSMVFLAFFNTDKPVLFPDITYGFYKVWADLYRVPYREVALAEDFTISNQDYQVENGGIILTNPNAPTGIYKELDQVEEILKANPHVIVVVDEAYINFGGKTALPLLEHYPNLFITRTFSKDAALAGLRVGYGVGSKELIAVMKAVKNAINPYSVDLLAERLATAAVEDWFYYKKTCQNIQKTRDWFAERLAELGFTTLPSQTNFVLTQPTGLSADELFTYLRSKKIYVRYFPSNPRLKDYLRISIGTQEEMERVITIIKEVL